MKNNKIHVTVYGVLTSFAGAFICFCYLYYWFISLITNSSFIVASAITVAILSLVVLPFFLNNKLKRWFGKGFNVLKWIYSAGMWVYVIAFSLFAVFIVSYDSSVQGVYKQYPNEEELVVITFGAKVHGMEPGVALRRRLDVTLELMNHYENAYAIVTGVQGAYE